MTTEIHLQQSMAEELLAAANYRSRADYAHNHGDEVSAKLWEHIAEEEEGHYNEFKDRLAAIREQASGAQVIEAFQTLVSADLEKGIPRAVGKRPFPKTDTEWEDLGFDIEAKLPASIEGFDVHKQTVRNAVATAIGKKEGHPEDAKRWLVQTADKLGVS